MAEAVVGVLIGKLGAALAKEIAGEIGKEACALKGLFGEIRKAEQELVSMKLYLHNSDKFKDIDNNNNGIFVNKIRELSFQIEDVIDEFMYKLEDHKHGGFIAKTKKRIKHLKVWHRLAHKLRKINEQLKDTVERRDRYDIPEMHRYAGSSDNHARSTNQTWCFAREDDLVGIEDNATKLTYWLKGDLEENNHGIATVWGMGGIGKTTLVDYVYKRLKLDFHATAWVTVSKSYQVEDLVKRIAREFGIKKDVINKADRRSLVEAIRRRIEGKRCILVLDDVWENDVWINMMEVFPTNCTKRFVLMTRKREVASLATRSCTIELEPLGYKDSSELLWRAACRNSAEKVRPSELHDLVLKVLQKCEGLPIAIACIRRLLSFKQPTYSEWDTVYKDIKLSLEDLPYQLKNCFLHCAILTKNYELRRRRLIRHLITSGFIMEKDNKTVEQVAQDYLNDLVNRSLLQVVKKNESGQAKHWRMHDVIRSLATEKAEKECFGIVYEGHGNFSVNGTRRLSIQSTNNVPLNHYIATHLRAIYGFTSSVDINLLRPILASSILLSTLDLQGTGIKMLPNDVFKLFNLRFLGLRDTRIEILPEDIGRLQNLEVLDAAHTCLLSLPKAVAKLIKLRYLYATVEVAEGPFIRRAGVKVPIGIRNLTGLHVLQTVKASSETLCDVAALTELRKFSVDNVTSEHSSNLHSAVLNMSNLVSLIIHMSNENEVLPLEGLCLPKTYLDWMASWKRDRCLILSHPGGTLTAFLDCN